MRPDLPWNVAGIPSEAREAARAAARREGLSVGEWLTRRILAGLSDMSEARTEWSSDLEQEFRAAEPAYQPERRREDRLAVRRDSDEMLNHVSRSESETADIYRRIEGQLRSLAHRLDASERSQTENTRVVSKAAVEMNIAAREQAMAFDQLGAHVAALAERVALVERRDINESLREAIKALHQGLTRVADQITQTANQSAAQISSLADNLEGVAGRVSQARQDAQQAKESLEAGIAALDDRVRTLEKAAQASSGLLDRALEALDARQNAAKDSASEAIGRLEDSIRRIETKGLDPAFEQRLGSIERTLADVSDRLEAQDDDLVGRQLEAFGRRIEALEATYAEWQKSAAEPIHETVDAKPAAEPIAVHDHEEAASYGALPSFDAPPPVATAVPSQAPQPPPSFADTPADAKPSFSETPVFETPAEDPYALDLTTDDLSSGPSTIESYLSAARRSARAAADAETEHPVGFHGLRWPAREVEEKPSRARPIVLAIALLIALAILAAIVFSRASDTGAPAVSVTLDKKPTPTAVHKRTAVVVPQQVPVGSPVLPAAVPSAVAASPEATPSRLTPPPNGVRSPQMAAIAPPRPTVLPTASLDKLTALANGGNARAELVVGLKYLDGDGVPVNEPDAARWLERAANGGEAVAEYRLGTLYERGRGVPADAAKADRWYLAAANQGNRKAMHNLAVAYAEGSGVKKDYFEASRWFLKAANLGLSDSQFNLAVLFERGLGVPQNLVDAYKWYAIAAAQGDLESKSRMIAIGSQLSADDRAAAQHAADTFRPAQLSARANVAPTVAELTR